MRLCKDCRFLERGIGEPPICAREGRLAYEAELKKFVTGGDNYFNFVDGGSRREPSFGYSDKYPANETRMNKSLCGHDAKWFEEKNVQL